MTSSSSNFPIVPPPDAIDQEPIPVDDIVNLQQQIRDDPEDGVGGKQDKPTLGGDNATDGDLSEEENDNNFGGANNAIADSSSSSSSSRNYRRLPPATSQLLANYCQLPSTTIN